MQSVKKNNAVIFKKKTEKLSIFADLNDHGTRIPIKITKY